MTATPMMKQYLDVRAEVGADTLLAYRMGDFYEFFFKDAETVASALDLVLTKRGKHEGEALPMCGFPVHSAKRHLADLVKAKHSVALCEVAESQKDLKRRSKGLEDAIQHRTITEIMHPQRGLADFISEEKPPRLGDYVGAF